jgi:hypothetical protein
MGLARAIITGWSEFFLYERLDPIRAASPDEIPEGIQGKIKTKKCPFCGHESPGGIRGLIRIPIL